MKILDKIEATIKELQEEVARLREEAKETGELRKRVEQDDNYCYITSHGTVERTRDSRHSLDYETFERGNYYLTNQAAEEDRPYVNLMLKLRHIARDLNDGWIPDWGVKREAKYHIGAELNGLRIEMCGVFSTLGTAYFKSEELAQKALDSLSEEELELLRNWR